MENIREVMRLSIKDVLSKTGVSDAEISDSIAEMQARFVTGDGRHIKLYVTYVRKPE